MSTIKPLSESLENPTSESLKQWRRDENGTYEITYQKGKPFDRRLANSAVRITRILYKIRVPSPEIAYEVQFSRGGYIQNLRISHQSLADEKAFLDAAPAGFALNSGVNTFSGLRECLMQDLETAEREAIVTVLGWYIWQGKPIFAHAGGVICSDYPACPTGGAARNGTSQTLGLQDLDALCSDVPILAGRHKPINAVHVEVPPQLRKYRLPKATTKQDVIDAVKAVLELLKCGPRDTVYVGVAAVFAATIRDPRFGIFLYGQSGSLKTAFALILLSFFVPDPKESDCASFKSTGNAINARFAASGNVPVVVDDYVGSLGGRQSSEEIKKADDVLRSIVNGTGKERCGSDGSLRRGPRPRGLPVITGEVLPDGLDSLRQRTLNLPVDKDTFDHLLNGDRPNHFDFLQRQSAKGTYALAMSGFIGWLSGRLFEVYEYLEAKHLDDETNGRVHRRTIDATNELFKCFSCFAHFAQEIGACSATERDQHEADMSDARDALIQRSILDALQASPADKCMMLIRESLLSLRCHIEVDDPRDYRDDEYGVSLRSLGYSEGRAPRKTQPSSGSTDDDVAVDDDIEYQAVYQPHGACIGFFRNGYIDLIPSALISVANSMAVRCGSAPLPPAKSLGKMLSAGGYLAKQNNDRNTYKVRRDDTVFDVWRIRLGHLFEFALNGSDFECGCLKEGTELQRAVARREWLDSAREKLQPYMQVSYDRLLNNDFPTSLVGKLTPPPCPPSESGEIKRSRPAPAEPPHIVGYSETTDDDLIA